MPLARVVTCTSEDLGEYATAAGMSGNSSVRVKLPMAYTGKREAAKERKIKRANRGRIFGAWPLSRAFHRSGKE